jgi:hypothetical protein
VDGIVPRTGNVTMTVEKIGRRELGKLSVHRSPVPNFILRATSRILIIPSHTVRFISTVRYAQPQRI